MKLLGIGSRIQHPEYGKGVITNVSTKEYWVTFIENGLETIPLDDEFETIEAAENEVDTISLYDVERTLKDVLRRWSGVTELVPMDDKWKGGMMTLKPGRAGLTSKDVPIDTFFHKIVMTRDRLRVMEQKINASNLDAQDKVELQQYITKIYGTLTTFNVLFKSQNDYFVGEKTK
ncbi:MULTISPECIES: hypothetical protein [unclassified Flavobacterium]|uniref:hypothetical protein n=1 Tax=unclassified Flavobacterium TaxID=196869 RepID=UPI001F1475C4|nr:MULTISPECIES: hypothetical protein [unclassified Flavobacterium]UMY64616.1 hypothetical protein MKO97_08835 [Flavobacterium sp. HJ-32-4]